MARRLLLYLCAEGLRAGIWEKGRITRMRNCPADARGRMAFADMIRGPRIPALMVVDLMEEDFRIDDIPRLPREERAALIRHKLEQFHAATPFRNAVRLRRANTARNSDKVRLSALTRPELVSPWLDMLSERQIPLAAIHSAATIGPALLSRRYFPASSTHTLLLSWQRPAGLRLTCLLGGQLHFSRLVPPEPDTSLADTIAAEIARTRQYLFSTGLMAPEHRLDAVIVCHAADRTEINRRLAGNENAHVHSIFLDINELGKRAGAKDACADSDSTPLLMHLAAVAPPRAHYAGAAHTRLFRLLRTRRMLYGAGALLAAACLPWSLALLYRADRMDEAARMAVNRMDRPPPAPPPIDLPASPSDIRSALHLLAPPFRQVPFRQAVAGLGNALEDNPHIRLERLSWQAQTAAPGNGPVIEIDVSMAPPGGYREALDMLEQFRAELAQHGYQTHILPPARASDGPPARFQLRLRHPGNA